MHAIESFRDFFLKLASLHFIMLFTYIHEDLWRVFIFTLKQSTELKQKPPTDFSIMTKKPHFWTRLSSSFCDHLYTFYTGQCHLHINCKPFQLTWKFLSHDLYLYSLMKAFILSHFSLESSLSTKAFITSKDLGGTLLLNWDESYLAYTLWPFSKNPLRGRSGTLIILEGHFMCGWVDVY